MFGTKDETSNIVILGVDSEESLISLSETLKREDVRSHTFYESEYPEGFTALCTEPIGVEKRKLFKKYRLWNH
jgi:hypothetical protein